MTKQQQNHLQKFLFSDMNSINSVIASSPLENNVSKKMGALVRKARLVVQAESEVERVYQLLNLVYNEWGFHCNEMNYFNIKHLQLDLVLQSREGMPVTLGAIVLYLAAALDLPIYPVNFPTQLILRVEMRDSNGKYLRQFINPWNGQQIDNNEMLKLLEGEFGFEAELKKEYLQIANKKVLQERLDTVFKIALSAENRYEEVLKLIQYRLIESPEDPYEIRDRGMILASLGCYQAAIDDLSYFIDQCPDDPTALMLKMEMPTLKRQSQEHILH